MKFTCTSQLGKRKAAGALVLPFFQKKEEVVIPKGLGSLESYVSEPIKSNDFKAKDGDLSLVYLKDQPEKRLILMGLGVIEKMTPESLRRAYALLGRHCISKGFTDLNLFFPHKGMLRSALEGLLLVNYNFDLLKGDEARQKSPKLIQEINLIGCENNELEIAQKIETICEGVYFARDLVNGNADDVTPDFLAQVARGLSEEYSTVKTTVFDKKRIEKEKMGLLLAVNRGSSVDPVFIIAEYKGNPKSKDLTILVGKGVTYDTGGLSLKPTEGMMTMRGDMGGSALALGTLKTAAELKLKVNLTVVIPSTDNCIDSRSYKVGDTYKSYAGKTVEIGNTDAEGRLILADALAYAVDNLSPSRIIDFATLTGAMDIALGPEAAGFFSNNDELSTRFQEASANTSERVWRMPLFDEYRDYLRSDFADMKNVGTRSGGACVAAAFLKEFIGNTPWVHFDIASMNYFSEARRFHPKNATGFGVRLMVEFLEALAP